MKVKMSRERAYYVYGRNYGMVQVLRARLVAYYFSRGFNKRDAVILVNRKLSDKISSIWEFRRNFRRRFPR
jgi:hypothetical protein